MSNRRDGRNRGQGWLLELMVQSLLQEWGYETERSALVRGLEADVIGVKPGGYPERLVVQCKDWNKKNIHASVIFRLITIAVGLHAQPVLVHNSELSGHAQNVCKGWGVRCITTDELELPNIPDPVEVDDDRFVRIPEIAGDTLPASASIKPIYEPFHARYREYRYPDRLDFQIRTIYDNMKKTF